METSLHRQLKAIYAVEASLIEVAMHGFRIDAIDENGSLVEVQHAGLGSIRAKIKRLLKSYNVRVIKPLVSHKTIQKVDPKNGRQLSRRNSPKHGTHLDIFSELLHFTDVFPNKRLVLEVPLVHVEEIREVRKNRRWRSKQYRVLDQRLIAVEETIVLRTNRDLIELGGLLDLGQPFDTQQLAVSLDRPRSFAQQVAYVLRKCGATTIIGKRGNAHLYKVAQSTRTYRRIA